MNHLKGILGLLMGLWVGFYPAQGLAETVEIVTYYPSAPPGTQNNIDRLHANRATIGQPYSMTNPTDANLPNGTLLIRDRVGVGLDDANPVPAGRLHILGSPADINLIAQAAPGQTVANLAEFRDADGTAMVRINPAGGLFIQPNDPAMIPLQIRGVTGQTAGLLQLQNVAGTSLLTVAPTGNLGIGTTTPNAPLHIQREESSSANPAWIQLIAYGNNFANTAVSGGRARGTLASPLRVQLDDYLFQVGAVGHDGAAFGPGSDVKISFHAAENFTPAAHGTYMRFLTTPLGSAAMAERMRIVAGGNVGIGTPNPTARLEVNNTLRLTPATDAAATAVEGAVHYDSATRQLRYHDGTAWRSGVGNIGVAGYFQFSAWGNSTIRVNTDTVPWTYTRISGINPTQFVITTNGTAPAINNLATAFVAAGTIQDFPDSGNATIHMVVTSVTSNTFTFQVTASGSAPETPPTFYVNFFAQGSQ